MGRRDFDDQKWYNIKEKVRSRDRNRCRAKGCLSLQEIKLLGQIPEKRLDQAHCIPVSSRPDLCYNPNNIYLISRTLHRRLDTYQDLVTGDACSLKKHYYWWYRIIIKKVLTFDEAEDYESRLLELIVN